MAGFGSPRLRLVRRGFAVNHDPNATAPIPFTRLVNDPNYAESWSEGLSVWHNPRAKVPLPKEALPFASHHELLPDKQVLSTMPDFFPYGSVTYQTLVGEEQLAK